MASASEQKEKPRTVVVVKEDVETRLGISFFSRDPQEGAVAHAAVLKRVDCHLPAAGILRPGDQILAIDGMRVHGPSHAIELLGACEGNVKIRIQPKRADFDAKERAYESIDRRVQGFPPLPPPLPIEACVDPTLLRQALAKGADVDAVSAPTADDDAPLHPSIVLLPPLVYALHADNPECVQLLLTARANVNLPMGKSSCTVLHVLCKLPQRESHQALMLSLLGAGASVHGRDADGLQYAGWGGGVGLQRCHVCMPNKLVLASHRPPPTTRRPPRTARHPPPTSPTPKPNTTPNI